MSAARLDIRESQHPKCGGKGCQERNNVDGDGLCSHTVSALDNLPVRCVGEWAYCLVFGIDYTLCSEKGADELSVCFESV